jgi:uncharacterized protein
MVDGNRELPESLVARSAARRSTGKRSTPAAWQKWSRLLHVYSSMLCFLVVLFFSVTGITLNHPTWSFGNKPTRSTVSGTLPTGSYTAGKIDWLAVAEFLRAEHSLKGSVSDKRDDAAGGNITFKGPGYLADASFASLDGSYELAVEQQGFVGVFNDLHKGRDSRSSWKWLIDLSGGLLVFISLSGLLLQLFLKKRRRSAVITAASGSVVLAVLTWLALR